MNPPPDHETSINPADGTVFDIPLEWREGDIAAIRRAILLKGSQVVWDGERAVDVWFEEKEGKFVIEFYEKNKAMLIKVDNLEDYFKESIYPFRTLEILDL